MLNIKPGITDIASIVFSDENEILKDSEDPDLDYNRLIRPWKSRLGIIYVENYSLFLDIKLILLTVTAIISREKALAGIQHILDDLNVEETSEKCSFAQDAWNPFRRLEHRLLSRTDSADGQSFTLVFTHLVWFNIMTSYKIVTNNHTRSKYLLSW